MSQASPAGAREREAALVPGVSRWGLFGGSFDPPHLGHLRAAFEAMELLLLEGVLWVPTPQNPLKRGPSAAASDRRDMVAAAIAGEPRFALSTVELDKPGPAYTADTLATLAATYPERSWTLILGADAWAGFARWSSPLRILAAADVAVAVRPGSPRPDPQSVLQGLDTNGPFCYDQDQDDDAWTIRFSDAGEPKTARVRFLNSTALPLSSTALRELLAAGRRSNYLVSEPVRHIIEDRGLYGSRRR